MGKYINRKAELSGVTLDGEVWKEIKSIGHGYMISSLGRIYSNVSKHILHTKPCKKYGYIHLPIGRRENIKSYRIHRLVAEAFIPNPLNKKEVNHINKNRADNRVENLEWSTAWENTQHKYGKQIWHTDQTRINYRNDSLAVKKMKGFSDKIIPLINRLVPIEK